MEEKLNAAINHPVTQQPLDYRRCMEYQVEHLTQVIRGTASGYQPLVFR
ncbi:hypothetical protein [Methylovulum psychrotolerans]|nr:hypothetical protein [Methylovulum psychrotolerans]